jgi:hypothetical protein
MLTTPLTSLAKADVTLVPGDKEYTKGRLIWLRTWHYMSFDKCANNHSEISSLYTRTKSINESKNKKVETEEYLRYIGYLSYIQVITKHTVMFHCNKVIKAFKITAKYEA